MKGLSLLLTIALFLLAQGLARHLKRAGVRPEDYNQREGRSPIQLETSRTGPNRPPEPIYL
jgi:hypothetical protein